jgi:DNA polymerase-3 subunit gamma/tau
MADVAPAEAAPAPSRGAARPAATRGTRAPRDTRASRGAQGPPSGSAPTIQRYGEAVVRDLLGATFLEEVEAPPTRFGERS